MEEKKIFLNHQLNICLYSTIMNNNDKKEEMRLNDMKEGQTGIISKIDSGRNSNKKSCRLGLTPGTR